MSPEVELIRSKQLLVHYHSVSQVHNIGIGSSVDKHQIGYLRKGSRTGYGHNDPIGSLSTFVIRRSKLKFKQARHQIPEG